MKDAFISQNDVEDYQNILGSSVYEKQSSASGSVDSKGQKKKPSYHKEGLVPQAQVKELSALEIKQVFMSSMTNETTPVSALQ